MTTTNLFAFMIAGIVVSGIVLFGSSLLARRASSTYTAVVATFAFILVGTCGYGVVSNEAIMGEGFLWRLVLTLLPIAVPIQRRSLRLSWGQATAGLLADLGLGIFWFVALVIFEMILTGDGGPGFDQYGTTCMMTFVACQIALPPLIARGLPRRERVPPRIDSPGEYPRS